MLFYPVWRHIIAKNFCICKHSQRFHSFPTFSPTLHQLVWLTWCWWLGLLCPVLQTLGIHQGFLWLFYTVALTTELHIVEGQECICVNAMRGGWHWIVILHLWGTALTFGFWNDVLTLLANWGCQSCLGPLTALATMTVFSPGRHAKGSSFYCLLGRVPALWVDWDHLCIHHWPKVSPPWLGIPGPIGWVWVGILNPLAWAVTSLSDHPMPSCLPKTVDESHQP